MRRKSVSLRKPGMIKMSGNRTLCSVLYVRKRCPCIGEKFCSLCLSWRCATRDDPATHLRRGHPWMSTCCTANTARKVVPTLSVSTEGSRWPKCPRTRVTDKEIVTGWYSGWNVWAWPRFIAGIHREDKRSTEKNEWNDIRWLMTICKCEQALRVTRLCYNCVSVFVWICI